MSKVSKASRRVAKFVDCIIVLCLLMCIIITAVVLWDYHRLDALIDAGVLTVLFSIWGGELLLIVVRQVLGSDIRSKNKKEDCASSPRDSEV